MLGSADRDVVVRDPGVPALEVLLDPDLLAARLSERLARPCSVEPGRLRYKPGTSCVLAFDLEDPHGTSSVPCIAKAYARTSAAKLAKSRVGLADQHVLLEDRSALLLVTLLAGDRHLAVGRLMQPAGRAALLERLLGPRRGLDQARLTTLRHNPERRWVGAVDLPGDPAGPTGAEGERIVVRSYRPAAAADHIWAYQRLGGTAVTPSFLGRSRRHGLLAVGWVEGSTLSPEAPVAAFAAAGRAVAALHRMRPPRPRSTPPAASEDLSDTAAWLAVLLPSEAGRARALAADVAARLGETQPDATVLHGDLSPDQMILDTTGAVRLIDLDAARVGEAAEDLGSAWASLLVDSPAGSQEQVTARVEALLDGYEQVAPLPAEQAVRAHRDSQILRRAGEAFRARRPLWAEHLSQVLSLAEQPPRSTPLGERDRR